LFADDTCLIINEPSSTFLESACNLEQLNLSQWCSANKLQIHPQKSNALYSYIPPNIRTRSLSQNPTLTFNNTEIECLSSCKFLGMHLDPNLDFKSHIQHLETKIAKSVDILSKLRILLPKSTFHLLYYASIHSHLLYALPVCIHYLETKV